MNFVSTGTPGVYRRGERYVGVYREIDGQQRWRSFDTPEAAAAFRAEGRAAARATRREIAEIRRSRRAAAADALGVTYADTRRLAQALDRSIAMAGPRGRRHVRTALDHVYRAEDEIRSALAEERGAA